VLILSTYRMSAEPEPVSYVNISVRESMTKTYRQIHFDFSWLTEIVESIFIAVKPLIDNKRLPLSDPSPWWVHG